MECRAGTIVLLHFHSWHRACRQVRAETSLRIAVAIPAELTNADLVACSIVGQLPGADWRLMFKMMFVRTTAPPLAAADSAAHSVATQSAWPVGRSCGTRRWWRNARSEPNMC